MLKLQSRSAPEKSIWLVGESLTIGRGSKNHLVIDDPDLDDIHAELQVRGDSILLIDKSGRRTTVNNKFVTGEQTISLGDVIRLNTVELEVIDPKKRPAQISSSRQANFAFSASINAEAVAKLSQEANVWSIVAEGSWLDGKSFAIGEGISVGRDTSCDIVIPGTHLSRLHARLLLREDKLRVVDAGSANGTFVNGKKISEVELKAGDRVQFDVFTFKVNGPQADLDRTMLRAAVPAQLNIGVTQPKSRAVAASTIKKDRIVAPASSGLKSKTQGAGSRKLVMFLGFAVIGSAIVAAALAVIFTNV